MDSSEPAVNFLGRTEFMARGKLRTSVFGLRTSRQGRNPRQNLSVSDSASRVQPEGN